MKTIAVYSLRDHPGYNEMFLSLLKEGRRHGWDFVWVDPDLRDSAAEERARIRRMCEQQRPDGFVCAYVAHHGAVKPPKGVPSVWVNMDRVPAGADVVRHDNASFGSAAAHVLADFETDFAAFGLKRHKWSAIRERAFTEAIRASGKNCRSFRFDAGSCNTYDAVGNIRKALESLPRPVSVFAVSDKLAALTLSAAKSLGLRCPHDIRLVGVDDDEILCMSFGTPISSVHPDWALGGRFLAESLEAQMRGEPPGREYTFGAAGVTRRATTREPYRRPRDEQVERGLAFIAAEFDTPIGVMDVIRAMGASRSHGELRFKEETGKTILEEIGDRRWEKLKVLLARSRTGIIGIHRKCGFRSASALRQFFRRRSGMSMTEWRKTKQSQKLWDEIDEKS